MNGLLTFTYLLLKWKYCEPFNCCSCKMSLTSSVTKWLEYFPIFAHSKQWKLAQKFQKLANFFPKLNKPATDCQRLPKCHQSGRILPHLVTLWLSAHAFRCVDETKAIKILEITRSGFFPALSVSSIFLFLAFVYVNGWRWWWSVWQDKNRQMYTKVAQKCFWHLHKNCITMWAIWVK